MSAVKATWKNGQVVLDEQANWPEGRRLVVRDIDPLGIKFMTEDEQSDDPAAIEQWISDLRTIPPVPYNPSEAAEWLAWEEKMRLFNIEAVRRQFVEGS